MIERDSNIEASRLRGVVASVVFWVESTIAPWTLEKAQVSSPRLGTDCGPLDFSNVWRAGLATLCYINSRISTVDSTVY
jgi:hypothetical protein